MVHTVRSLPRVDSERSTGVEKLGSVVGGRRLTGVGVGVDPTLGGEGSSSADSSSAGGAVYIIPRLVLYRVIV
ncbi:hypothetical protein [Halospeciosus flavus]|uniref:hypothetical protein n=1 Tax=Halospeciosus flavus TaxID=3032283 RepID=UPI0036D40540